MTGIDYRTLAGKLTKTVQAAGRAEMEIYQQNTFKVETKKDDSPVTIADRAAEEIILKDLAIIAPDIPVVAEEAASEGNIPETGDLFFLVDPLDGTKEFIRKSNEFTVNIALISKGKPIFGIVYAPAIEQIYVTLGPNEAVAGPLPPYDPIAEFDKLALQPIATRTPSPDGLAVIASKSHMTQETKDYIERFKVIELKNAGSSLKFCLLAEGKADLYPRFGPTMEWDTAAGHAVLLAAGGSVTLEDGTPLTYGKTHTNYLNPFFIASGQIIEAL